MKIADESAIKSSELLVERQNYGFENFRKKLVRTKHQLKGMIQYNTRVTIHEIVQKIVSEPCRTTVWWRVIKTDKDLILQHQWGHMYKVSKAPERNPDIFKKTPNPSPKRFINTKQDHHLNASHWSRVTKMNIIMNEIKNKIYIEGLRWDRQLSVA